MGPNFTPLHTPPAPATPTGGPPRQHSSKKKFRFLAIAAMVLVVGAATGYLAISNLFYKSRASGSVPPAYFGTPGYSMSFDGIFVTVQDTNGGTPLKLVGYKANQPYWGETWQAVGTPTVTDVSNGSKVEVPCGDFQMDLIPRSFQVYSSPSYTGDRYGTPRGAGVLKAAVNGTRVCNSPTATPQPPTVTPKPPTATPKPPTSTPKPTDTPKPSPTPTLNPKCGSTCSSDSQCPAEMKCVSGSSGTYTTPPGKCVLTKCTQAGVVCSSDKCTVIPPSPTPTPKATATPAPSADTIMSEAESGEELTHYMPNL